MTLKYGAMGFELNAALEELKTNPDIQCYKAMKNISFLDVVHYGWSYMGILTGIINSVALFLLQAQSIQQ